MEFQAKNGVGATFFNDIHNKTAFAIQKEGEVRKYRQDNTKAYHIGKRVERPFFDVYEYKYGHPQHYANGTSWGPIHMRPYPTNEPFGLLPRYVDGQNNKIVDVSGYEIRNIDLYKKMGR